ncbi:MAG: ATP-binding protein [Conchiformibius sp.]|nr:ATP-binding protein [Conchiformibius sp.]
MIRSFTLENFGPITKMEAKDLGRVNLILAKNSQGKTFILKALYSILKSHEEANKGDNNRPYQEELRDKLYWTFQSQIGDLVSKKNINPDNKPLKVTLNTADNHTLLFSFGSRTEKEIQIELNQLEKNESSTIFLPPKEVLSLFDMIKKAEHEKWFGFDATYKDLVKALSIPTMKGRNSDIMAQAREQLEKMFEGSISFNADKKEWLYKKNRQNFSMHSTAEGVKKIAILDTLLGNRILNSSSVIFIDEPESNLHPSAISAFLDIVFSLSKLGMQIFMATHSYFVIKKMYLLAKQNDESIPVLMFKEMDEESRWIQENLKDGMPDNGIINESIRLFEEETDWAMGYGQ